jgi:putative hemolysin
MSTLALNACSSVKVQPAQPYGPDTYAIYATAKSAAKAHSAMLEEANDYCAKLGKKMAPISDNKIDRRQFELKFNCQ